MQIIKDYLKASSTATATATVAPTMGLLPISVGQEITVNQWLFSTPKHTNLCALICSVLTLVDEMWTRICPHLLYHILSTLSSVRFSSLHYITKHKAFPIPLIVGHDKTTGRKDFHRSVVR